MARFRRIAEQVGVGLPADGTRTAEDDIDGLLELSRSEDSRVRQLACKNLCTCHVMADDDRVWARLLELVEDPDRLVRGDVIHAITDSTPARRIPGVIHALDLGTTTRTTACVGVSARPSPTTGGPGR